MLKENLWTGIYILNTPYIITLLPENSKLASYQKQYSFKDKNRKEQAWYITFLHEQSIINVEISTHVFK